MAQVTMSQSKILNPWWVGLLQVGVGYASGPSSSKAWETVWIGLNVSQKPDMGEHVNP